MQRRRGRQEAVRTGSPQLPVRVGHHDAGFASDQRTGQQVGVVAAELPEGVDPSGGGIGDLPGGGAQIADGTDMRQKRGQ